MEKIWLQFSDGALTQVCGWSWWEQSTDTWPHQEQVPLSDSRYVSYYAAMIPEVQALSPAPPAPL
jgi:hypothetical protein